MKTEIGRQLKPSEITPPRVVWVKKANRPIVTMWAKTITERTLVLWSGVRLMNLILRRDGDELRDDDGPIELWDYTGEI